MSRRSPSSLPPPPDWLARSILGVGAVGMAVGVLVVVLRLTDSADDPSRLATVDTTSTFITTTTTVTPTTTTTTAPTTTTTAPRSTSTTTRRATTTTTRAVTTTSKPTSTTSGASPFTGSGIRWFPNGEGNFTGDVQVTNTSNVARSGTFTVRLYSYGELVGTMRGSRAAIPPGETVEVDLSSSDPYVQGVDDHQFSSTAS